MNGLQVSYDTTAFEVADGGTDSSGQLTRTAVERAQQLIDRHGFAIVPNALSEEEAHVGLELVRECIADPSRERSGFASETDIKHRRRDFCPLPSSERVLSFAGLLCRRTQPVLSRYCGDNNMVLEISTLTSYQGSSHQYIHRDPPGVLCMFVAVEDVSEEQGGTVFVPGTHVETGTDPSDASQELARLFQTSTNMTVLGHNLAKLIGMRRSDEMSSGEFWERVFSVQSNDDHQPNLYRFLRGGHQIFDRTRYGVRTLMKMRALREEMSQRLRLVQASPKKGTVIFYKSDMLHAGPDNRSDRPRYFFNINIARNPNFTEADLAGYAAHSSLQREPKTLGDLLAFRR